MPAPTAVRTARTARSTYRFTPTAIEDLSQHFGCRNVEQWNAHLADHSDFPQWLLDLVDVPYADVSGLCCHDHMTVLVYA